MKICPISVLSLPNGMELPQMNIGKWFKNRTLSYKLFFVYIIFTTIPTTIVTIYNSQKTKAVLMKQSYLNIEENLAQIYQNIDSDFQSYVTLMNMLYTNQLLNFYLRKEYTNTDYWDMFSYIDNLLKPMMVFEPAINSIRIYSDNDTLPDDNYYFFRTKDVPDVWRKPTIQERGAISVVGSCTRNHKRYIVLSRLLNYYQFKRFDTLLVLAIDGDVLNNQIKIDRKTQSFFLVTGSGEIIISSDKKKVGSNIGTLTAQWQKIPTEHKSIPLKLGGSIKICMAKEGPLGTRLIMMENQKNLYRTAEKISVNIITVFLISSAVMLLANYLYSRWMSGRVKKTVYAATKLGNGEFDYKLTDMGKDEIGIIADAINTLNDQIQFLIAENYEKKIKIKSSELNLLQEQINPHFLYNALSVISNVAIREGSKKTMQSVQYLANFYRISLNNGKQIVSVQEEIELLKNYMLIQQLRFGDTIEIEYAVESAVLQFRTLKLLLQPIVENSIQHGRRSEETILHIIVRAVLEKDTVVYSVQDDGIGIEQSKLDRLRTALDRSEEGYGLKNVDIRVKLNYGAQYGVTIDSKKDMGTLVTIRIPCSTAAGKVS
jgi:two-component system sensor histidine kinase YesM